MLYKLINNRPEPFTGRYIKHDGMVYANPTDEQLTAAGYKPLVTAEPPELREGYYAVDTYTETADGIVQAWTEHEVFEEMEV
jgi:hypothetical protein